MHIVDDNVVWYCPIKMRLQRSFSLNWCILLMITWYGIAQLKIDRIYVTVGQLEEVIPLQRKDKPQKQKIEVNNFALINRNDFQEIFNVRYLLSQVFNVVYDFWVYSLPLHFSQHYGGSECRGDCILSKEKKINFYSQLLVAALIADNLTSLFLPFWKLFEIPEKE